MHIDTLHAKIRLSVSNRGPPLAGRLFYSMTELFYGARLKIERAKKHIRDVSSLLAFINADPHAVLVETNLHTGYDSLQFVPSKPIPEEFMCVVRDALHNLRTALDFVANDIEFSTTGKRTKHTKFPIEDTRDKLIAAVNGGFKDKAPERVRNFIVDVIQPYETGDGNPIWALHALDIEDKHKLLIHHFQWQWLRQIRLKDESGTEFGFPEWVAAGEHTPKVTTGHRKVEVTDKGYATIGIVFDHGSPFSNRHILPTLNNLVPVVSRAVDNIERVFLGS